MGNSTSNHMMQHVGLYLPRKLVAEIDGTKGYYTRNKYVQKIIEEYFFEDKNAIKKQLTHDLAALASSSSEH